jgi:hypothetical protein
VLLRARCLALAAVLGCSACATRETESSRNAWKQALDPGKSGPGNGATPSRGTAANPGVDPSAWHDLASFTTSTSDLLSLGTSTAPLPTLIAKLCGEPPEEVEAKGIEAKAVRCPPKPTMEPLGHALTLELARGTAGLVATDLNDRDSAALVEAGLKQLAGACTQGWTKIPSRADNAHEEFHTCTAPSGSMVVLGRFPIDLGAGRWQFSLAVLGPG